MKNINLVYFSCNRDREMLSMSIESSRRHYNFNKIYVFSDPNDPIRKDSSLKDVIVQDRESGSEKLYGLDNIADMHKCLKIASQDCQYVLKKDSDILDCSSYAYDKLNSNDFDCFGAFPMARESMIPEKHFNGNAYFIKSSIIKQLPKDFPDFVHNWKIMNYPEDMVTSAICNKITQNIRIDGTAQSFNGRYLFDTFLTRIADESAEKIKNYGFAHCRSNFGIMEFINKKIYGKN